MIDVVTSALATSLLPALAKLVASRSTRSDSRTESERFDGGKSGALPVLAWLQSVALSLPPRGERSESENNWVHHVDQVRASVRIGDRAAVELACQVWGGDHLRWLAALDEANDSGFLVPSIREPVARHYRVGESIAGSLIEQLNDRTETGPSRGQQAQQTGVTTDAQRNHAWLQSGLLYGADRLIENDLLVTGEALEMIFEATTPEVAETQERLTALLTGFFRGLDTNGFEKLDPVECERVGFDAARDALAALHWSQVVGDRLDTTAATRLLGVTRQALAQRLAAGTIHGLPGRRTTHYPTWQFDTVEGCVREETILILAEFRTALGVAVDQFLIASWMTSPQSELDLATPIEWLKLNGDTEKLVRAARHSAARAAS